MTDGAKVEASDFDDRREWVKAAPWLPTNLRWRLAHRARQPAMDLDPPAHPMTGCGADEPLSAPRSTWLPPGRWWRPTITIIGITAGGVVFVLGATAWKIASIATSGVSDLAAQGALLIATAQTAVGAATALLTFLYVVQARATVDEMRAARAADRANATAASAAAVRDEIRRSILQLTGAANDLVTLAAGTKVIIRRPIRARLAGSRPAQSVDALNVALGGVARAMEGVRTIAISDDAIDAAAAVLDTAIQVHAAAASRREFRDLAELAATLRDQINDLYVRAGLTAPAAIALTDA